MGGLLLLNVWQLYNQDGDIVKCDDYLSGGVHCSVKFLQM